MKNEDRRANKKVLRLCRNIDKQADDLEKLHPASIPTIGGSEPVGVEGRASQFSGSLEVPMTGTTKQCWMEFAAFAAKEQDPKKLIKLARKINERLDERFRPLPEQKRSDPDVLADLRDALNRVRNAAWAVQQYVVRKESDQDSNSVLSFLAGERIRVAYQLCQALSDDLTKTDIEFQRGGLVQLHEVTKALTNQRQRVIDKM